MTLVASESSPNASAGTSQAPRDHSIDVRDVNLYYDDFHAVADVSFPIAARAVTALIGPSGCGKTSVLRALNRMHEVIPGARVSGTVEFRGRDLYGPDVDPVEVRRRIGMVFQRANPFPTMSIYANVLAGHKLNSRRMRRSVADDVVENALRRANLWNEVRDRLNRPGSSLSGGQQQRLCIARAISMEPDVLLMDEPCSALDPISTTAIEDLIYEFAQDYTIVIVTHNMAQAARVSDYTGFFSVDDIGRPGRLVEFGPTSGLFEHPENAITADYVNGRFG